MLKKYGLYTGENNTAFIVLTVYKDVIRGFLLDTYGLGELSNFKINSWIKFGIYELNHSDVFEINLKLPNPVKNWGYLGQIENWSLGNKLEDRMYELIEENESWLSFL